MILRRSEMKLFSGQQRPVKDVDGFAWIVVFPSYVAPHGQALLILLAVWKLRKKEMKGNLQAAK